LVDRWTVEISVTSSVVSDEAIDTSREVLRDLRGALGELPDIGVVRRQVDASVPGRQGGELLQFVIAVAPGVLELVLSVIRARQEARPRAERKPVLETTVRVIDASGSVREAVLRGEGDDVVRVLRVLRGEDGGEELAVSVGDGS
jgi:hypothetical protein